MSIVEISCRKRTKREQEAYDMGYEVGKREAVKRGYWEKPNKRGLAGFVRCSCCEDVYIVAEWLAEGKWNYCPNCGAKMEK